MSSGPLTTEQINALNAVDLQLLGIEHGTPNYDIHERFVLGQGAIQVHGITDGDYDTLLSATAGLRPERGDMLAIEPVGFWTDQEKYTTLETIVPFVVPPGVCAEMSPDDRGDIAGVLKDGRQNFRYNNFVYAAAHALLRDGAPVPIYRADASRGDFAAKFGDPSPYVRLEEDDPKREEKLLYRHHEMLTCLGNIALGATTSRQIDAADGARPVLLFAHCRQHTEPLAERLKLSNVAFTARTFFRFSPH